MNKLILFLALPALSAFALSSNKSKQSQPPVPADQEEYPTAPILAADLQGKYQTENGYGITVSGSALYWKADEEGLDYVIKNTGATSINNGGAVERAEFDWNWGFRADLGYQIPEKKMDLEACWTSYRTEGTVSDQVTSPTTLFSVWSVPNQAGNAYEFQSTARTHLTLNRVDFGMNTTFAPRPFLDITPAVNLSAVWIHQKFQFDLSGGPGTNGLSVVDDSIAMKNHFFGIGPNLGVDTLWSLGYGLGIFGNFNLSLIYGFFKISQTENVTFRGTAPNTYLDLARNEYHDPSLDFDLQLGIRWDRMFSRQKYHLLLEAGWESMIYMGLNQLMRFLNQNNPGLNLLVKGDLSFQGLSARATFTF